NHGAFSYESDANRIDNIAAVFPFIFFLVAALVSLTTMTRMVEDERIDIGTHKALGFSTARITAKYVAYAALAGILGSVLGIAILSQVLPWVVEFAYAIIYNIPIILPLPVDAGISLVASCLGLGVTFLAIFGAAAATLREVPATLMLPRVPKAGKRILLERVGIIWRNLSFSWKVTCRNLFRYKRRLAMTLIGIAGCTGLLLTGLGLHDSIWDIIAYQYENDDAITRYNAIVGMEDDATEADMDRVEDTLADVGGADGFARFDLENMQISTEGYRGTIALQANIARDCDSFSQLVDMRTRLGKEPIEFGPDSVVVTEKVARRLGVDVGDRIVLYDQDEIGNATGRGYTFTVTGICENYVFHYVFVGADAWHEATGRECEIDSILVRLLPGDEYRSAATDALSDDDTVSTLMFGTETIDAYRKSLRSVNLVVVVLVVAAAALAFIVLYNLINIQLIERTREIASLKVLGFDRREVAAYLFRETVLLVIV
ncbi:MAG: ABC transporter permease, partial [Coriobacteriaceae bacterium]|nr:ABC transporter permease [Coriobacteriaceae bacterium]